MHTVAAANVYQAWRNDVFLSEAIPKVKIAKKLA